MRSVNGTMVTTAFELPGYRIVHNLGLVRGLVVRSRSIFGNIGAAFQTLFGGNITLYTSLCEKARIDAYNLLLEHAADMGANAIIGVRYDANEVIGGVTEVLAYGTAVVVESSHLPGEIAPARRGGQGIAALPVETRPGEESR